MKTIKKITIALIIVVTCTGIDLYIHKRHVKAFAECMADAGFLYTDSECEKCWEWTSLWNNPQIYNPFYSCPCEVCTAQ